tara:strand:- start:686 stop:1189 length:504 start_codon:yes stop_codon:yes gene_type:complete
MIFHATINLGLENNPEANRIDFSYELLKYVENKINRSHVGFRNSRSVEFGDRVRHYNTGELGSKFSVMLYRKPGKYQDKTEDTMIIEINGTFDGAGQGGSDIVGITMRELCESMCLVYTQECVPYKVKTEQTLYNEKHTQCELVYNPLFTGEKFEFDGAYFMTIHNG